MTQEFQEQFEQQDKELGPENSAGEEGGVEKPNGDNVVEAGAEQVGSEPEEGGEQEQTAEQIREFLELALEEGFMVDLVIEDSGVGESLVKGLYVDEIDGDYLMLTYEGGEGIPLEIQRVKGVYKP